MPRPHVAALVHDAWNSRVSGLLRERGWGTRIVPHVGYGSTLFVRVMGRVVMDRGGRDGTDERPRRPRRFRPDAAPSALRDPAVAARLRELLDGEVVGGTPEAFRALMTTEIARWRQLIEARRITAD